MPLLLLANPCSTPPTDSASLQPLLARIKPGLLTEPERRAFGEAMFLAAETGRLDVATQLRAIGIAWPAEHQRIAVGRQGDALALLLRVARAAAALDKKIEHVRRPDAARMIL